MSAIMAHSTKLLRRYDFRRFGFGLVRSAIYAGGLFALALVIAFLSRAAVFSFLPDYLGEGVFGMAVLCTALSLAACTVRLVIDPAPVMLDTLRSNALNLFYKLGAKPLSLALVRPLSTLWALLRIYLTSFALSCLCGLALSRGASAATFGDTALVLLAGVCGIIILVTPALFASVFACSRLVSSLVVAVSAAALFLLLRAGGAIGAADEISLISAVGSLVKPSLVSVSAAALVCLALFGGGMVALCVKNLTRYDEEALDDEDLVSLGVTKDLAVYQLVGNRCSVVISGGELTGSGERPPDLIADAEGEFHPATYKTKSAAKKTLSPSKKKKAAPKKKAPSGDQAEKSKK